MEMTTTTTSSLILLDCKHSISSSEEPEGRSSEWFPTISILSHAMVQERLDQLIKERQEARHGDRRRARREGSKFIVMLATEMSSDDPTEDFRGSMVEMIMTANFRAKGFTLLIESLHLDEF
ncbi:hypothetical protein RJ639_003077 [Escallonia herrerae]|uniref:OVATE domain-containing protein n=1 Tax=Escallonia herrerae TaxID=1293975 RepID=A0AA88VY90_9ASTE|nr:hypothetical protein RJ639_003077 [Escallonia herrerae]